MRAAPFTLLLALLAALNPAAARAEGAAPAPPLHWDDPFPGVVHDQAAIRGFVGEYRWLSNFYPCPVRVEGLDYQSSEAAYQAGKFPPAERIEFTHLDPDAAKKLAHSRKLDESAWNQRKDAVMRQVVLAKFTQNPKLRALLVATGDKYLEETNWWNDPYWGVYQGKGENVLGHVLMAVRAELIIRPTDVQR